MRFRKASTVRAAPVWLASNAAPALRKTASFTARAQSLVPRPADPFSVAKPLAVSFPCGRESPKVACRMIRKSRNKRFIRSVSIRHNKSLQPNAERLIFSPFRSETSSGPRSRRVRKETAAAVFASVGSLHASARGVNLASMLSTKRSPAAVRFLKATHGGAEVAVKGRTPAL